MKHISKPFSATILLVFFFYFAQAQHSSIGLKAGIGIPNLTSGSSNQNPVADGWSSRLGPYFGITGQVPLAGIFSLQAELNYASQGGKKNGIQAIPNTLAPLPLYLYADFKSVARLNYLELPVMIRADFRLNDWLSFFANAGPYAGYLLMAKTIATGSSIIYADPQKTQPLTPAPTSFNATEDIKDQLKKFNVGIQGGIGLSCKLGKGALELAAGGNYGFLNIQKDTANGKNNTGAATITLGYKIHL